MRTITLIILHCSGIKPEQRSSARQIDQWHRAKGWQGIGYHYVVRRNGTVEVGRPETKVGAHCQGHNRHSIGICYEGGLDAQGQPADTRTDRQKEALHLLIKDLKKRYPKALVVGHNVFNKYKACPCFDAVKEYMNM